MSEAEEKQIPMKLDKQRCCDRCGTYCINDSFKNWNYCPDCGQKIDWSEKE